MEGDAANILAGRFPSSSNTERGGLRIHRADYRPKLFQTAQGTIFTFWSTCCLVRVQAWEPTLVE